MKKTNDDITPLAPRNRNNLFEEEYKLGSIDITKTEKVLLAKLVASPEWSILKNVWFKQRAIQIATTSINSQPTIENVQFYRGCAAENAYVPKMIEDIVRKFNQAEDKKTEKNTAPKPRSSTPGQRELISKVK